MFFDMQLSHNDIMQHNFRYYSVHQLGKVGKDVSKSHTCRCMSMLVDLLVGGVGSLAAES